MSETVSAFNPATGLFSDTLLNATDLNTAFTVKLAGLGGGSVGAVPYSSITGAPTLGPLAGVGFPAAGIVYSTGSAFAPLTIGANLTLTGSTLAATGGGGTTYTGTAPIVVSGSVISMAANAYDAYGAAATEQTRATAAENLRLLLSGGTLTGPLILAADPTAALGAATKQYVDAHAGSGGAVSSVVGQTGAVTATQIAAALPVAAVGTKGILSVDGTSIAVNGSGVASVVGTAPTAAGSVPAASALQLVSTSDTYFTGTQLQTIFDAYGAAAAVAASSLATANNLSDLANASTARTNLGVAYGTAAGTVAQGNDTRIIGTPTAVTAAGTNQGTATALTAQFITVTTTAAGQGVGLEAVTAEQNIANVVGGFALLVYPPTGGTINALAANAPVSLPFGTSATVRSTNGTAFTVTLPIDPSRVPTIVQNTYTAAGAIAITDDYSFVNSASTVAMTLAVDTVDLHLHRIFQAGAGTVTVTANIDGTSQTISLAASGSLKSTLLLRWSAAFSTYFVE